MLYVIAILLIVLSLKYPSNKMMMLFNLIFMWILFAFNSNNADYSAYERIYQRIGNGELFATTVNEEGYIYLAYFSSNVLHLNYQQFLILVASLSTILLYIVINLYLFSYQNIVLSLFLVLNYWTMICQYRSYIASLLVLIGFYFLLNKKSLKSVLAYIVFVLLGCLFHRAVLIYLIFPLFMRWKLKNIIKIIPVLFCFVMMLRSGFTSTLLSKFITGYKLRWLTGTSTRSALGIAIIFIIKIALSYYEYKASILLRKKKNVSTNLFDGILKITTISISFAALEMFYDDFERLFRIPLILSFVYFARYTSALKFKMSKVPITVLYFIGFYILYAIYFYISFNSWFESVLIPVFTQNSLINMIF